MSEEKRQHVRWRKKVKVSYALKQDQKYYEEIFTEDISEEGIQILIDHQPILEQNIRLKLEFWNDSVPIMLNGKAVYVKPAGKLYKVGLTFVELDDFQRQRIKRGLEESKLDFNEEDNEEIA